MKKFETIKGEFYLIDELNKPKGKTHITNYVPTAQNMPHQYFRNDYIVIYGRSSCPYCQGILSFLKDEKPELYEKTIFVEIDTGVKLLEKSKLLEVLKKDIKKHNTVPMVFDHGKFIGGSSDAKEYFSKK